MAMARSTGCGAALSRRHAERLRKHAGDRATGADSSPRIVRWVRTSLGASVLGDWHRIQDALSGLETSHDDTQDHRGGRRRDHARACRLLVNRWPQFGIRLVIKQRADCARQLPDRRRLFLVDRLSAYAKRRQLLVGRWHVRQRHVRRWGRRLLERAADTTGSTASSVRDRILADRAGRVTAAPNPPMTPLIRARRMGRRPRRNP